CRRAARPAHPARGLLAPAAGGLGDRLPPARRRQARPRRRRGPLPQFPARAVRTPPQEPARGPGGLAERPAAPGRGGPQARRTGVAGDRSLRDPGRRAAPAPVERLRRTERAIPMTRATPPVRTGLDVLTAQDFDALRGLRVGLVANAATVDWQFRHAAELLSGAAGVRLGALFGPEHGLFGQAQDLIAVRDQQAPGSGLPVYSLY